MWRFSYHFLYVVALGLLLTQGACQRPKSHDISIGNVYNVGGDRANNRGCALQSTEDWQDGRRDWYIFHSDYREARAWMNINGHYVELRECRTSWPNRRLRRDDRFSTDYYIADVMRFPCPDDDHENHGWNCPLRDRRYSRDDERERDFRGSGDYLSKNDRSYPDDTYPLRNNRPGVRMGQDYGPAPGVVISQDFTSPENRFYGYSGPRDNGRYRNPPITVRELSVRINYLVLDPCRWEDRGCRSYVRARITFFRNEDRQQEIETAGTCNIN
jgi:hypothetical protein